MSRKEMLSVFYDAMVVFASHNYYEDDFAWDVFHDLISKEDFIAKCDEKNLSTFDSVFEYYKSYLAVRNNDRMYNDYDDGPYSDCACCP